MLTDIILLCMRLAHPNAKVLKSLPDQCNDIIRVFFKLGKCHPCQQFNATKKNFDSSFENAEYPR